VNCLATLSRQDVGAPSFPTGAADADAGLSAGKSPAASFLQRDRAPLYRCVDCGRSGFTGIKGHNCGGILNTKNLNMEQILTPAVIPANLPTSNPEPTDLDRIATAVRKAYPLCKQAWQDFNQYRFGIGLCLIRARELLDARGGNHNPSGKNQHGEVKLATVASLTLIDNTRPSFTADKTGLISWMRKELNDIPLRTLLRYRQWTETKALPIIERERQQLQLPIGDMQQIEFFALPEEQRGAIGILLKQAVSAKDLTQTLRAMDEAPGDPDAWGPQGGARHAKPRRNNKAISEADWESNAAAWVKRIDVILTWVEGGAWKDPKGKMPDVHFWDTLPADKLESLKLRFHDLHQAMIDSQNHRAVLDRKHPKQTA